MNDLIVDTDTSASGEAVISEEGGLSTTLLDMISNNLIKLIGAYTLADAVAS